MKFGRWADGLLGGRRPPVVTRCAVGGIRPRPADHHASTRRRAVEIEAIVALAANDGTITRRQVGVNVALPSVPTVAARRPARGGRGMRGCWNSRRRRRRRSGRRLRRGLQGGAVKVSSGSLRSTIWFVPSLGNWVRFESEILNSDGGLEAKVSQELVRFDRRATN